MGTKTLVITIDGPAGVGKSTVSRELARRLDMAFLDTGAMYRAVTLAAMLQGADVSRQENLLKSMATCRFRFVPRNDQMHVRIDGVDVTEQIRDPQVTANAKYAAGAPAVRDRLVEMQRDFAKEYGRVVTEGRDQGTVVFPDAACKFFLTADVRDRARRRQEQLAAAGKTLELDTILQEIEERDASDRGRTVGPLTVAADAVTMDTTDLTAEQVVEKMVRHVRGEVSPRL